VQDLSVQATQCIFQPCCLGQVHAASAAPVLHQHSQVACAGIEADNRSIIIKACIKLVSREFYAFNGI